MEDASKDNGPNNGETKANGSSVDQYEERMKKLERRIAELEKENAQSEASSSDGGPEISGLVDGVMGQFIPGLSGIIKALEKSSPEFRKRIAETDSEIKHRLDTGWSNKPVVDYHFSTRPLSGRHGSTGRASPKAPAPQVKLPANGPAREPIIDIFEDKDYITVIAELPGILEADLDAKLSGRSLEIRAGELCKKIELPSTPRSIVERSYKNGIFQLKISREDNGNKN